MPPISQWTPLSLPFSSPLPSTPPFGSTMLSRPSKMVALVRRSSSQARSIPTICTGPTNHVDTAPSSLHTQNFTGLEHPPNVNVGDTRTVAMQTLRHTSPVWAAIVARSRDLFLETVFRNPGPPWGGDVDQQYRQYASEALEEVYSIAVADPPRSLLPEVCGCISLLELCAHADFPT